MEKWQEQERVVQRLTEQKLKIYADAQEVLAEFLSLEPSEEFDAKLFGMLKDCRKQALAIEEKISALC